MELEGVASERPITVQPSLSVGCSSSLDVLRWLCVVAFEVFGGMVVAVDAVGILDEEGLLFMECIEPILISVAWDFDVNLPRNSGSLGSLVEAVFFALMGRRVMKPSSSMIWASKVLDEGSGVLLLAVEVESMEGIGSVLFKPSASLDSNFTDEKVEAMSMAESRAGRLGISVRW